jgi:hypothetical protein
MRYLSLPEDRRQELYTEVMAELRLQQQQRAAAAAAEAAASRSSLSSTAPSSPVQQQQLRPALDVLGRHASEAAALPPALSAFSAEPAGAAEVVSMTNNDASDAEVLSTSSLDGFTDSSMSLDSMTDLPLEVSGAMSPEVRGPGPA